MLNIVLLHPRAHPDCFGYIPGFLDEDDPRPVAEQFNERYMGGWNPQDKFKHNPRTGEMFYPGDPPMPPVAAFKWKDEMVMLYPHAYVAIFQADGSFEICRMD